jgi:sulfite exporter TauE/SafE
LISSLTALFVTGLTLGVSQCLLSCTPMLVLYVAGTTDNWREGLKATLVFSLARLLAYVLLGTLAGFVGVHLVAYFREQAVITWIQLAAAAFVILKNNILSMALLGFLIGIVPYCAPFLGILTYIAFTVRDPLTGALYGLSFGLGSALLTPLLIAGPLAGLLPRLVFKNSLILELFRRVAGVILLFFGIRLILNIWGNL